MDLRENNIDDAADDTCQWLPRHPSYVAWLQDSSSLLWIKGKPGAGKSTLLKYAFKQDPRDTLMASFYFNARGHALEKTALGFYRSILHQLLPFAPECLSRLALIYEQRSEVRGSIEKEWDWSEFELKSQLRDLLLNGADRPIRLYVDALDESGKEVAVDLVYLFSVLIRRARSEGKCLSICFSCRHYPIVMNTFEDFTICIEHENSTDLRMYVHHRLEANCIFESKAELLARHILEKACGVFQWIKLVLPKAIDSCRTGTRIEAILTKIRALPSELYDLYKAILAEIPGEERPESLKLLQWICFAIQPLSVGELRDAMAVDVNPSCTTFKECMESSSSTENDEDMEKKILHLSRGLAEVKVNEFAHRYIQFIHESVNDFLVPDGLVLIDHTNQDVLPSPVHFHLASICVRYLDMDDITISAEKLHNIHHQTTPSNHDYGFPPYRKPYVYQYPSRRSVSPRPFIRYATLFWIKHARMADEEASLQQRLLYLFIQFLGLKESRVGYWTKLQMFFGQGSHYKRRTIQHVIAEHGLYNLLSAFLSLGDIDFNAQDSLGNTPLHQAAGAGQVAIVELLADRPGINRDAKNVLGETPLSQAAQYGSTAIVKILAKRDDVDVNCKDTCDRTPLLRAASRGHETIVKLLSTRDDVDVNVKDNKGWTPLIAAAFGGHEAVVRILGRRHDTDFHWKDVSGRTALSAAAFGGHEEIELLLGKWGDLDPRMRSERRVIRRPLMPILDHVLRKIRSEAKMTAVGRFPKTSAAGRRSRYVSKHVIYKA